MGFSLHSYSTQNNTPFILNMLSSSVVAERLAVLLRNWQTSRLFFAEFFGHLDPALFQVAAPCIRPATTKTPWQGMLWTRIPNRKRMFYVGFRSSTQELGKLEKDVGPKHPWALKARPCGNEKQLLNVRWRTYQCALFFEHVWAFGPKLTTRAISVGTVTLHVACSASKPFASLWITKLLLPLFEHNPFTVSA